VPVNPESTTDSFVTTLSPPSTFTVICASVLPDLRPAVTEELAAELTLLDTDEDETLLTLADEELRLLDDTEEFWTLLVLLDSDEDTLLTTAAELDSPAIIVVLDAEDFTDDRDDDTAATEEVGFDTGLSAWMSKYVPAMINNAATTEIIILAMSSFLGEEVEDGKSFIQQKELH
jgi:hypothetical protein